MNEANVCKYGGSTIFKIALVAYFYFGHTVYIYLAGYGHGSMVIQQS